MWHNERHRTDLTPSNKHNIRNLADIFHPCTYTTHERILIAKVREYDYNTAKEVAKQLERLALDVDIPEAVKLMKRTVPEFISKNSPYEIYDK